MILRVAKNYGSSPPTHKMLQVWGCICLLWCASLASVGGDEIRSSEMFPHESGFPPSLDPSQWSKNEMEFWLADNMKRGTKEGVCSHPTTSDNKSVKGVVASTSNSLAAHCGAVALEVGGSAADAAIVTSLTSIVLAAGRYISFNGIASIITANPEADSSRELGGAATGRPSYTFSSFHAPWLTPKLTDPNALRRGSVDPNTIMVGGFLRSIADLHAAQGKLEWAQLFQPAIYFANKGFPMQKRKCESILDSSDYGQRLCGQYGKGFIQQPEVGNFLERLASEGVDYVYGGEWAEGLCELLNGMGTNHTVDDFQAYSSSDMTKPTTGIYASTRVAAPPPPLSYGGVSAIEQLRLLEMSGVEGSIADNATTLSMFTVFYKWQLAVELSLYGGSERMHQFLTHFADLFPSSVPTAIDELSSLRVAESFAASLWAMIKVDPKAFASRVDKAFYGTKVGGDLGDAAVGSHSDHVVAIDSDGNVISMSHTLNANAYGSGIFFDGIALSNAGGGGINYDLWKNWYGVGRRLMQTSLKPLVAVGLDGQTPTPELYAVGSIGASLTPATTSGAYNLISRKIDACLCPSIPHLRFPVDVTRLTTPCVATPCVNDPYCSIWDDQVTPFSSAILDDMEDWVLAMIDPQPCGVRSTEEVQVYSMTGLPVFASKIRQPSTSGHGEAAGEENTSFAMSAGASPFVNGGADLGEIASAHN